MSKFIQIASPIGYSFTFLIRQTPDANKKRWSKRQLSKSYLVARGELPEWLFVSKFGKMVGTYK